MTAARALRIVTAPERTVAEVRTTIAASTRAGADAVEVRVDRLPAGERAKLPSLFPSPLTLLAAYRSTVEGGEGEDRSAERAQILDDLIGLPFDLIDLEAERDARAAASEGSAAHGRRWVLSRHLGSIPEWTTAVRSLGPMDGDVAFEKLVVPATVSELFDVILPQLPSREGRRFTVHTVGPSGPLLRVRADALGFAAVYCAPPAGGRIATAGPSIETAQVPVDWLPHSDAPRSGRDAALLGRPVAHSLSPGLFARWARATQSPALYVPIEVRSVEELHRVCQEFPSWGFVGVNITHPWKAAALAIASESTGAARRCGAANLLRFVSDGVLADNTDRDAIVRRLRELRAEGRWTDGRLLVIGTGGMAAAVLDAARELEAATEVAGRTPDKVEGTARRFGARPANAELPTRPGLIVHATTVGRSAGSGLEVPIDRFLRPGAHVLDAVYAAESPVIREAAGRAGASYEDGTRLLVYQSAESYARWGAEAPPAAAVESVLQELGCAV